MTLTDLSAKTESLLASGADIHAMNAERKRISRVKGGKLLAEFKGQTVTTLAISDVEGDALSVIGSGIGDAPETPRFTFDARIVASNAIAREAIKDTAGEPLIVNAETLYDDVDRLAVEIGAALREGPNGLYVWGGEPTVVLPEKPGKGGRNMALALAVSREVQGLPVDVLVAGTDGTDGPTDAAGAGVSGTTWAPSAADALARADAYSWCEAQGILFKSGPTGTNVMDLCIARKG
jgi:hydroxypyruvate reductase